MGHYPKLDLKYTLQAVSTLGATCTNDIFVNSLGLYDSANAGYGNASVYDSQFIVKNIDNDTMFAISSDNIIFQIGTFSATLSSPIVTSNTIWNLPVGSGTLALTGDLVNGYVPYNGANSNVNLGSFGLTASFLGIAGGSGTNVGRLSWNDTDGTLDLGLKGGNVTLQIGQEQLVRVVNKTATSISLLEANYQAVRVTGAQGQRLKVDLAQATSDALSAGTIGIVTETIANNQEGFITTSGLVRKINTTGSLQSETWTDGDILYLSGSVAGNITNVKPSAPIHTVIIGYVVHAHATQGSIFVKVDNGYELDELHNVLITGVTGGQVLSYDNATSLWKNTDLPTPISFKQVQRAAFLKI